MLGGFIPVLRLIRFDRYCRYLPSARTRTRIGRACSCSCKVCNWPVCKPGGTTRSTAQLRSVRSFDTPPLSPFYHDGGGKANRREPAGHPNTGRGDNVLYRFPRRHDQWPRLRHHRPNMSCLFREPGEKSQNPGLAEVYEHLLPYVHVARGRCAPSSENVYVLAMCLPPLSSCNSSIQKPAL